MTTHSLKFVHWPPHDNELENTMLRFREFGFAVIRDVFERDSVDAFDAELRAALVSKPGGGVTLPDDSSLRVWPARAPRIRAFLDRAFSSDAMHPRASMFEAAWLIQPSAPEQVGPHDNWHKDRGHRGDPLPGYHYPKDVHVGMYFSDMTLDHGPTQIIAGSHMDQTLSPFKHAPESFLLRKQDVMLWDQRCWHRGTNRVLPGERIFALYGFYPVPVYHEGQHRMTIAQRDAWKQAATPQDRVYFGGTFTMEGQDLRDPGALGY